MKTSPYLIAALLITLSPPGIGSDGDWPMWRHDPALTGYQPTPEAMAKEPRILARHFLGASPGVPTFADLLGSGRDAEVLVLAAGRLAAYGADGGRLWESRPQGYVLDHVEWVTDLDGDGRNDVVALAGRMGNSPGVPPRPSLGRAGATHSIVRWRFS